MRIKVKEWISFEEFKKQFGKYYVISNEKKREEAILKGYLESVPGAEAPKAKKQKSDIIVVAELPTQE